MSTHGRDSEPLLTPAEVADLLNISTKTLARWTDEGHVPVVVLPMGRRRYRPVDVAALTITRRAAE